MANSNTKILILCILVFSIYGCSQITQQSAESIAQDFVGKRVKFFLREGNLTKEPPKYEMRIISSYKENNIWTVLIHISSTLGNETKANDLVVKVDSKGKVIEFNGVPVISEFSINSY